MATSKPKGWNKLPQEIRQKIWGYVTGEPFPPKGPVNKRALGALASVCREWQAVFEQYTFANLFIDNDSVEELARVMEGENARRLGYIHRMLLSIQLEIYECRKCNTAETVDESDENSLIFTQAVSQVFSILAKWKSEDHRTKGAANGLWLDLEAYSPSDNWHNFHHFRKCYPVNPWTFREVRGVHSSFRHSWRAGRRHNNLPLPGRTAAMRVMGTEPLRLMRRSWTRHSRSRTGLRTTTDLDGRPIDRLPYLYIAQNEVVWKLSVRRDWYRLIHPHVLAQLAKASANLSDLRIEQWRPVDSQTFSEAEAGYTELLDGTLPPRLRHLNMYQESNHVLNPRDDPLSHQAPCQQVGLALAGAATQLCEASVAYYADAYDFFMAGNPEPDREYLEHCHCEPCQRREEPSDTAAFRDCSFSFRWPRLRRLALTSRWLSRYATTTARMQDLLLAPCKMMDRMSALTLLEIWFAEDLQKDFCLFQFRRMWQDADGKKVEDDRRPNSLSLTATWDVRDVLSAQVVRQWQSLFPDEPMAVETEVVERAGDGRTAALSRMAMGDFIYGEQSTQDHMEWERGKGQDMV